MKRSSYCAAHHSLQSEQLKIFVFKMYFSAVVNFSCGCLFCITGKEQSVETRFRPPALMCALRPCNSWSIRLAKRLNDYGFGICSDSCDNGLQLSGCNTGWIPFAEEAAFVIHWYIWIGGRIMDRWRQINRIAFHLTARLLPAYKRWSIEVFFRNCKQKLAFDKCQLRKQQGIERMWLLLSLVHFLCCTLPDYRGAFEKGFAYFRECLLQA